MRRLRVPFVVDAPGGASVTTRLRVSEAEHDVLVAAGDLLGGLRNRDLVRLLEWNRTAPSLRSKEERNAEAAARKRDLTARASSRAANSIVRSNNDQRALGWRNLLARRASLDRRVEVLARRCAVEPGERDGAVRGYRDESERAMKRRRLGTLRGQLARVQRRIEERRPSICVGGRDLARKRHNLDEAGMTVGDWRSQWDAKRRFLTFIGTNGERFGNDTLIADPHSGAVTLNLPAALARLSNVAGPGRLFRFASAVEFGHRERAAEWATRAAERRGIRHSLRFDPSAKRGKGAWYLTASWSADAGPEPDIESLRESPTLGVDLNAGWIAACAVDTSGNPIGRPVTVSVPQQGPSSRRLGQMRAAVGELLDAAAAARCASVTIENLDFADARDCGRETLGRGQRGRRFRRQIAGIPTAILKATLASMAYRRGIAVVAVDPAYTSKWARQHNWRQTINCSSGHRCSSHHGAAVVIARRGLGHRARRAQGQQSMAGCSCLDTPAGVGAGRAAGVRNRGRSVASRTPPRQPHTGRKTGGRRRASATGRRATPFGATLRAPPQAHSPEDEQPSIRQGTVVVVARGAGASRGVVGFGVEPRGPPQGESHIRRHHREPGDPPRP